MLGRLRSLVTNKAQQPVERMICGLGNPGPSYANTRHNAGYRVVAGIAAAKGVKDTAWTTSRGLARLCTVDIEGVMVVLVQPLTFMNLSGQAVRPLLRRFGLSPEDLLVICDDLDLRFGALRLRATGSAGGHRGLQSIIDQLCTQDYARFRIGVGRPPDGEDTVPFVLGPVPWDLRQQWEETLDKAVEVAQSWVSLGTEAAMNRFNKR